MSATATPDQLPVTSFMCVVGIDGSGKSALLERASVMLPNSEVIDWKRFHKMAEIPGVANDLHLAYVLPLLNPIARASLILYLVSLEYEAVIRAFKRGKHPIIIDSYWYKFAAKEKVLASSPDFLFDALLAYPQPATVVFLNTPPRIAHCRKQTFTPYEGGGDQDSFMSFQSEVQSQIMDSLRSVPSRHDLDGALPLLEVCREFVDICQGASELL